MGRVQDIPKIRGIFHLQYSILKAINIGILSISQVNRQLFGDPGSNSSNWRRLWEPYSAQYNMVNTANHDSINAANGEGSLRNNHRPSSP